MTLNITSAQRNQILASLGANTFYIPNSASGGVKVEEKFKEAVKKKTVEITLLEIKEIVKQGRTNKQNIATSDDVFRAVCRVSANEAGETDIRLHLCDVIPMLKNGNKGTFKFGVYAPSGTEYLVPENISRASFSEISDYITAEKPVTANT